MVGTGVEDYTGDGGSARVATLSFPQRVRVAPDQSLYIIDSFGDYLRRVLPEGTISSVAGGGADDPAEGVSARTAALYILSMGVTPDGELVLADSGYVGALYSITPPLPGFGLGESVVASPDGSEVYRFDPAGRHLRTVDALTGTDRYRFTYTTDGLLTQVTDANNNVTTIERAAGGMATAIVSPFGQRTTLLTTSEGFLSSVTNPASEQVTLSYEANGLLRSLTDPRGGLSEFTYNADGRLVQDRNAGGRTLTLTRTEFHGGHDVAVETGEHYTLYGRVLRPTTGDTKLARKSTTGIRLDIEQRGDATETWTRSDGVTVTQRTTSDPRFGLMVPLPQSRTLTTPGGLSATATTERTVTLTNPDDPLTLTKQTDRTTVNGRTTTQVYTQTPRTRTVTSPEGRLTTSSLDAQGRVVHVEVPGLAATQFAYDARGRVSTVSQGARMSTWAYNANGYLASVTDPLSRIVTFARDAVGRVTSQTLPGGRTIQFNRDANGNVTSLTPPGRDAHTFTYSPMDLVARYGAPSVNAGGTNATTYTYNLDHQLTTVTRPDGQQIVLVYDNAGRVSTQTTPTGQSTYAYDPVTSNLRTLTAPGGETLAYSYDGSLPTSMTWTGPIVGSVGVTYDNNFRVTAQSVNGGNAVTFTYDDDGLLTGAGALSLNRDAQNGLLTSTSLGSVSDSLSYSALGEPSAYEATVGGTTFRQQYTRDNLGRITTKTETTQGVTDTYGYTYDLAGRLTEVKLNGLTLTSYAYDSNGNRVSKTSPSGTTAYTYDAQDRLLTQGPISGPPSVSYTYTANGELQGKTLAGLSASVAYSYDVLGNLRSAVPGDLVQVEYVHDGQNRRIGKKVNGTLVQGFLYQNQLNPVAELDGTGAVVSRFVYASKGNVPDYMVKGGVTYRIISDHLGSPRLVVNTSSGAIAQRLDYDEFGQVITDTNPGFQPFGFAGGLYDRDTKLVRFGARDYDAETGRWTAKDPILFAGGDTNLYGYVLNDPINFSDSSGLFSFPTPAEGQTLSEAGQGASAFVRNYKDMRNANTIGADKYFHCKANCEAAQAGSGGESAAKVMSEARELTDEYIQGDPSAACNADRQANQQGQQGAPSGQPCSQVCNSLRPPGLPPQY